jgi:sigma-B regulation protein RsbU (phosphoserine phosphatase)
MASAQQLSRQHGESPQATRRTVLVVDDEPVTRVSLTARLTGLGYRVIEAGDGLTGLEMLRKVRPDLTILDWMMPGIDGPTFCERVRQDPELQSSQILLMTGHDQPQQIAEGLARGADDFLSKSASKQEITARVQAGMRAARLVRTLEQARDEIQHKQEALERELRSAARYVESLLPAQGAVLPGLQLVHIYRPSLALGGDLFNVEPWNDGVMGLYLLDASGHGVAPALRSAAFSTFLRREHLRHRIGSNDPGATLTEANKQFPLTEEGEYFTIIYATVDLNARRLSYATAGHSGAFLQRRSGTIIRLAQPGLPLGFDCANVYRTTDIPLEPGDRLYVFSDGLYEVAGESQEIWGQDRLEETVRRMNRAPLQAVIDAVVAAAMRWQNGERFQDDVAMMGIEIAA